MRRALLSEVLCEERFDAVRKAKDGPQLGAGRHRHWTTMECMHVFILI
jgi:hypothetical protein